jgi:hypothetical protein
MQPKKPMSPAKCRSCYRGPICTLDLFLWQEAISNSHHSL